MIYLTCKRNFIALIGNEASVAITKNITNVYSIDMINTGDICYVDAKRQINRKLIEEYQVEMHFRNSFQFEF